MQHAIFYIDKKNRIRSELVKLARKKPPLTKTYGDFGRVVEIPTRGPWKGILDLIGQEEAEAGRPDITYLVINKRTGYPSQIGFHRAIPPSVEQKKRADKELAKIADYYKG